MEKKKQPSEEARQLLDDILNATPETIVFCGRKRRIGWVHFGTERMVSHVIATEKEPHKRGVKVCTLLLLNSIWKIRALYWLLWRWYYYVKDLDDVEILRVLLVSKKKMQTDVCFVNTTLMTAMSDLTMSVKKEEA